MHFLIMTASHGLTAKDQLMTNELVGALQNDGHTVDVMLLKWQQSIGGSAKIIEGPLGEDILYIPPVILKYAPNIIQRIIKWSLSPLKGARFFRRFFGNRTYDGIIAGTPAMLFGPCLKQMHADSKQRITKKILFIHDFFPIHHVEIGLVPQRARALLQWVEERAMSKFDIIYCNLPSNVDYLQKNYRLSGQKTISWMPLWTRTQRIMGVSKAAVRQEYALPETRPIAVFGGQLVEGRGIEEMIAIALLAEEQKSDIFFLFIGSGRLSPLIDEHAARPNSNVRRIAQVPRDDYLGLISACDVGMAVTVPGVSSHSFPTKSMDYLRVGIPVVVALEPDSSLGKMLTDAGVGFSVCFGDFEDFLKQLEIAVGDINYRTAVAASARKFLDEILDVKHVPRRIIKDISGAGSK